jgi:hypothetical protein
LPLAHRAEDIGIDTNTIVERDRYIPLDQHVSFHSPCRLRTGDADIFQVV